MQRHATERAGTPGDRFPLSALGLLTEGYGFLPRRFQQYQSDVIATRLLGQRVICIRGPEAARVFYDSDKFERSSAVPGPIQKTVSGEGGVQVLDGARHRRRKAMFMQLMTPEAIHDVAARTEDAWREALPRWENAGGIVLFDEAQEVLCQAGCAWAGVPLARAERRQRAQDMISAVDGFGSMGPRHWRGRIGRRRSEAWIEAIVEDVRAGRLDVPDESPLHAVAFHQDADGEPLTRREAAVEVLNLVRPLVAVAWFAAYMAMALYEHPEWKDRIRTDDDAEVEAFVHETRRYYPFTPVLGARVRRSFEWQGHTFSEGTLVLLDVFGMQRDGRLWERPGEFRPERFLGWTSDGYDFIPQGGGDHDRGHRCAGEWITIAVMKTIARLLCTSMEYDVPEQDMRIRLSRMPAMPRSGVILTGVRRR